MNRRRFLSTLPVVLAGCGSVGSQTKTDRNEVSVQVDTEKDPEDYSLDFEVTYPDAEKVLADLLIEVENTGTENVGIETGPPVPFGIIVGESVDDSRKIVLWSEDYETSGLIDTEEYTITFRTKPGLVTVLQPGDSVSSTYTIRSDAGIGTETSELANGTYDLTSPDSGLFEISGSPVDAQLEISGLR